jgi:polyhydroxyalkanoate synthesis regulator phasin
MWAPLQEAVTQARGIDKRARKLARQTADDLYNRSEALLTSAQKQSARTVKSVRKNLESALETIESRTVRFSEVPDWARKQLDEARKQLSEAETQLLKGVETIARGLHLAVDKDVDALRRKLHHLEKRVGELAERESKAA